jgi:hypothetical protein
LAVGGNILRFPTVTDGNAGYFEPNPDFTAVPEPSTHPLFAVALMGITVVCRRRA